MSQTNEPAKLDFSHPKAYPISRHGIENVFIGKKIPSIFVATFPKNKNHNSILPFTIVPAENVHRKLHFPLLQHIPVKCSDWHWVQFCDSERIFIWKVLAVQCMNLLHSAQMHTLTYTNIYPKTNICCLWVLEWDEITRGNTKSNYLNGMIVVGWNGRACWCGNPEGDWFDSNFFVALPSLFWFLPYFRLVASNEADVGMIFDSFVCDA